MSRINLRRDGFALALLAIMLVLLAAAVTGAYRAFGYALVALLGMLMGLGFVRRADPVTWVAPCLASAVLLIAMTGMFASEHAVVRDASDTVLGFQAGTAFLVYGVWIPAFFTMGLAFALVFDRLGEARDERAERSRETR